MKYANIYMKKIITVLLVLITILSSQSQSNIDSDLKVLYKLDYKKFDNSDDVRSAYTVLISKNQGSLFTFEKMMSLDSIQRIRELDAGDVMFYRPAYFLLTKRENDSIFHYEMIGKDLLQFKESINLEWKLVNESKNINGFLCKKATLNYGGRNWIAWYTPEIPKNTGPYKFYGLPGLIMSIKDDELIFEFEAIAVRFGSFDTNSNVDNFFVTDEEEKFEEIEKEEFYELRSKFYAMTLKQRLDYMNREDGGIIDAEITNADGERININRKSKKRNFIERENK
mgnify:CR=1 FL=1